MAKLRVDLWDAINAYTKIVGQSVVLKMGGYDIDLDEGRAAKRVVDQAIDAYLARGSAR